MKTVSIDGLLKEFARSALGESNIMLQFNIADDLWSVEADQAQLGQVINNIVSDAKGFLLKGGLININATNLTIGPASRRSRAPFLQSDRLRQLHCQGIGIQTTDQRII